MLLFNIFLSTSIHLPNLIKISGKLIHNGGWSQNLRSLAEAQNPTKKLITDFHLSRYTEMAIIDFCILNAALIITETIYNRIQKRIDKTNHNTLFLASKHREDTLGVGFQVDCGKGFLSVSWLSREAHILHAVNSVSSHVLCVIVKSQKVVVTVID